MTDREMFDVTFEASLVLNQAISLAKLHNIPTMLIKTWEPSLIKLNFLVEELHQRAQAIS